MARGPAPAPAPDEDVWLRGIRWVQAVRMQADRFEHALREWEAALIDADLRNRFSQEGEFARSWRDSEDLLELGSQAVRVPTVLLAMQVAAEVDFLLVAVRNVLRAQHRLPETLRTAMTGEDELKALRDFVEHFDEVDGRAAHTLRGMPHFAPGAVSTTGKDIWIGGDEGVPLSRIRAWAIRVWRALAEALTAAGIDPPRELHRSMVDGDEELPWPAIRLRYDWTIPQVPEEEWPTQQMPDELEDLLAEQFHKIRMRDAHE